MVSTPSLPSAAHEIAVESVFLSDDDAQEFLQRFPLVQILETLQRGSLSQQSTEYVCAALKKVFSTAYGASQLPQATPYALAALDAPSVSLRRLGCQQLAAALQVSPSEVQQRIVGAMLHCLADKDTGVAFDAAAALQQYGTSQEGLSDLTSFSGAGQQVAAALASHDPVVRMRVISLIFGLAGQSQSAMQALQQSGLLQPLVRELTDQGDPLSCLAALSMLKEQLEGTNSAQLQSQLAAFFLPHLEQLLQHADAIVKPLAMQVTATLSAAALKATQAQANQQGANAESVVSSLKRVLDVNSQDEFPAQEEQAALDALGTLGMQREGAEAVLLHSSHIVQDVASKALGRAPTPDVTLAAVHALATIAGAERAGEKAGGAGAGLSPPAEEALKAAVYEGAAFSSHKGGPVEVLMGLLQQPFLDLKVAAYRLLGALMLRAWGAGEVCMHPRLLSHLCDPKSETSRQGCEFRYSSLQALAATTRLVLSRHDSTDTTAREVLKAWAATVQAAIAQGVYGSGQGRAAVTEHQVATMQS